MGKAKKEYYIETENTAIRSNQIEYFVQKFRSSNHDGPSPHIHPAVEILHVTEGRFEVWVDEKKYELTVGETVLIRSNAIHSTKKLSPDSGAYRVLKFKPDFLVQFASPERVSAYLLSLALTGKENKTVWNARESTRIAELSDRLFSEAKNGGFGSDVAIKLCAGGIALELLRDAGPAADLSSPDSENLLRRVYDAIIFINGNYEKNVNTRVCAKQVFLSYSYFSRNFKRITGRTFTEYLNQTRINQAQKALLSSNAPVSRICVDCGFNNFAYFSAVYRRLKGVSPSEERKKNRK